MHEYAEIIVDLISNAVDRPFHYRIPPALRKKILPGMKVAIPLGPRRCEGYVLRLLHSTPIDPKVLRDIYAISDPEPLLTKEQLTLLSWLAHRCYCRKIDALNAMVPASFRQGRRSQKPYLFAAAAEAKAKLENLDQAPAQKKALQILLDQGPQDRKTLEKEGVTSASLRALETKGLIEKKYERRYPAGEHAADILTDPLKLGDEQAACFERIAAALDNNQAQRLLLHGITASGKTEVYMQSISRCLDSGKSALVMVPEIALTPQMINHFEGRFPGHLAVLHSRLTQAEKSREWQAIQEGEARVVLGARSAVFAPLANLGLIVIDEEHETTYKQEEAPRYHARDVAWWRARYNKAVLVLGSATPSLESYYRALEEKGQLLTMTGRITPTQLPPVTIVDMRQELKENHRQIFSRLLLTELDGVLERGEQALLFINRRGFAGFVLCRECGYVVRCPSCDVSLTLHLDRQ